MLVVLGALATVLAALLGLWAGVWVLRDRAVVLRQLQAGAVVEAVLLVQLVAALVLAAGAGGPASGTYWLYVAAVLVILPIAALWAFAERTRWSSVVLLVASLAVIAMQWRILALWSGA